MSTRRRPSARASSSAAAPATSTPSAARKRRRGDEEESEAGEEQKEDRRMDHEGEEEDEAPADKKSRLTTPARSTASPQQQLSPLFESDPTAQPLLRTKRLEEKNELQELNKRLELYIIRQRERDAAQGGLNHEIQILKERFKSDLSSEKKHHEQRYDDLKKQKLDLANQLQELQDAHAQLQHQAKDFEANSNLYKERCKELEKRLKKVEAQLDETQRKLIAADTENKRLKVDYEEEKEAHILLQAQLESEKQKLANATKSLNAAQSKLTSTQQDFDVLSASSKDEIKNLTKQVTILRKENQSIEDELRKEFGNQLQKLLQERQEVFEQEKEEAAKQLKEFYETTLQDKTNSLNHMSKELERAQKHTIELQKLLDDERKENVNALAIRAEYEKKIAKLQANLEANRERFEGDIQAVRAQVIEKEKVIQTKDLEFQNLMDVKIALDMEIKQYHSLLDHEENRLGLDSTPLTAKSASRLSFGSASKSSRKSTTTSSSSSSASLFSSSRRASSSASASANLASDLSLAVIVSANKLTLTNSHRASDEDGASDAAAMDLNGCTVYASKSKQRYEIAEAAPLLPGQSFSLFTNSAAASAASSSRNHRVAKWAGVNEEALWKDGEVVQIRDSNDKVLTSIQIRT